MILIYVKYILSYIAIHYIVKNIYKKIFIDGCIKIPLGEYSIRRIKYNFDDKIVSELKEIALNSVGIIPLNPYFKGKNLDNKIALIIYHKNKPIGFNVMFDYTYKNLKCLHLGLVLIDKNYQGKKIQNLTKYNIILYLLENIFSNIYLSDLGRSASGLKIFNTGVKNSYPNLIYNNKCTIEYKEIFNYFLNNFREDTQISTIATRNDETFVIEKANNKEGGANYLLDFEDTRKSKDEKYNNLIKSINIEDIIFSIGIVNIIDSFF
jgi:hypothetical protein